MLLLPIPSPPLGRGAPLGPPTAQSPAVSQDALTYALATSNCIGRTPKAIVVDLSWQGVLAISNLKEPVRITPSNRNLCLATCFFFFIWSMERWLIAHKLLKQYTAMANTSPGRLLWEIAPLDSDSVHNRVHSMLSYIYIYTNKYIYLLYIFIWNITSVRNTQFETRKTKNTSPFAFFLPYLQQTNPVKVIILQLHRLYPTLRWNGLFVMPLGGTADSNGESDLC